MKQTICTVTGVIGGFVTALLGGWNAAMISLVMCMVIDYGTGIAVAGIFHNSAKSGQGGLDSRIGWKGLFRKVMTLLLVVLANQMDIVLGIGYIRDMVVMGFLANECLSILENASRMGVPIPKALANALDQLTSKSENVDNETVMVPPTDNKEDNDHE